MKRGKKTEKPRTTRRKLDFYSIDKKSNKAYDHAVKEESHPEETESVICGETFLKD